MFVRFVCFVVYYSAFRTPNSELGQGGFWQLLADKQLQMQVVDFE